MEQRLFVIDRKDFRKNFVKNKSSYIGGWFHIQQKEDDILVKVTVSNKEILDKIENLFNGLVKRKVYYNL